MNFFKKIFDPNQRDLDRMQKIVDAINVLEPKFNKLSDADLKAKTVEFRRKLKTPKTRKFDPAHFSLQEKTHEQKENIREQKEELFGIMPEAFATVQQAVIRTYSDKRRYPDVQFLGAITLSEGNIAEMKTGEGKTQTAWLALYLYALLNRGAHLVAPNDYLARVGAEYSGHVFARLGMSVGVINPRESFIFVPDEELEEKKGSDVYTERMKRDILNPNDVRGWNLLKCSKRDAYNADITYSINSELGFDYLRDNMVNSLEEIVQGELFYAIVDEIDSILIDEARTPLIISGQPESAADTYKKFAHIVSQINESDYEVDEKAHSVVLTESGTDHVEKLLGVKNIYEDYSIAHHLENALKAKLLYKRDDEYIIKNGQVLIVDEFTGRILPGRRYSQGLHQAIEAKENVDIQEESRTIATITYQNFFRLYSHLAGMTGTALTEAEEFNKIYNLDVISVPTRLPVVRQDHPDVIYKNQDIKYRAIVNEIKQKYEKGQPVLVGTTSVEKSEYLSQMLQKEKVLHEVLNAKHHEKEAKIVEKAGQKSSITIATNMAGRGTDIVLGPGVIKLGGLHVLGTERHEARRIDNQLRGRSGRQGDPGSSRFYVALDDELMRIHGGEMISNFMETMGVEDLPIEASLISNSIEKAQKRVEGYHFDIRKRVVEYDDVLNQQRELIYKLRRRVLAVFGKNGSSGITSKIISIEKVTADSIKSLEKFLDDFSINNKSGIPGLLKGSNLEPIWRIWIIKKLFAYIDRILLAQTKDDKQISDEEEKNVLSDLRYLFPDDLLEKIVQKVDYKTLKDFYKSFIRLNRMEEERILLKRILLLGYSYHIGQISEDEMQKIERILSMQAITNLWMDHLDSMDDLREGIGLRGYGQLDPLVEYKKEGFRMFDNLLADIDDQIISRLFKVRVVRQEQRTPFQIDAEKAKQIAQQMMQAPQPRPSEAPGQNQEASQPDRSKKQEQNKPFIAKQKVGRNDPCPCGSGKKYKKCHGKNT